MQAAPAPEKKSVLLVILPAPSGSPSKVSCIKTWENILLALKGMKFYQFFPFLMFFLATCMTQIAHFRPKLLPAPRFLDIPALLTEKLSHIERPMERKYFVVRQMIPIISSHLLLIIDHLKVSGLTTKYKNTLNLLNFQKLQHIGVP
jgi:hypothetical protein